MHHKRNAFTLIELLVVIAIIAILAAILFPVFAAAKTAAKGAASISNTKQIGTSHIMYGADNDDKFIMDCTWGGHNGMLGWNWADPTQYWAPWPWILQPYMKNANILQDPLTTAVPTDANWGQVVTYCEYPEFGYNYSALSPALGWTSPWVRTGVSQSSLAKVAETVLITSHFDWSKGDGAWWWAGPNILWNQWTVEQPDCNDAPGNCWGNWGDGWMAQTPMKGNIVEGARTGGVAIRKAGKAVVGWADGHTSVVAPGKLAAGTTWTPTSLDSAMAMNDWSQYVWDVN